MKRRNKISLIVLVAIAVAVNIGGYFLLVNKLLKSKNEVKETRTQIIQEILQKQNIQDKLEVRLRQLQDLQAELEGTKDELNIANKRLGSLEKVNLVLLEERETLQTRLTSLKELKRAIRRVKIQIHQEKVVRYRAAKKMQKEIDAQQLASGNRGYMIKDGRSRALTWSKPKIEVTPAE